MLDGALGLAHDKGTMAGTRSLGGFQKAPVRCWYHHIGVLVGVNLASSLIASPRLLVMFLFDFGRSHFVQMHHDAFWPFQQRASTAILAWSQVRASEG